MRISPINNRPIISINKAGRQSQYSSAVCPVNFQNRRQQVFRHSFTDSMLRQGFASSIEWAYPFLKKADADILKKFSLYNLGEQLSMRLYNDFAVTGVDYSDFMYKLRTLIISEGFFASFLSTENEPEEYAVANKYLTENCREIISAANLLGENSILYAASFKRHRFENLLYDIACYKMSVTPELYEVLLHHLNPIRSSEYKALEKRKNFIKETMSGEEFQDFHKNHEINKQKIQILLGQIKELKQNFTEVSKQKIKDCYIEIKNLRALDFSTKPEEFKKLELELNRIKSAQRKLSQDVITDPQKKIEYFYVYKAMAAFDTDSIETVDSILRPNVNEEEAKEFKKHLLYSLQRYLGLDDKELEILHSLKLEDAPYFFKLLEANKATKESLKYLFSILAKGSDSIADTIDNLEQNKLTRELFEKENLDYASWVGLDEERDVIKYDTNTVIRKVDMNDIKHSLFLGNQACCCTAIGTSTRSEYAPLYIMNNFLQAIELVVDGKAVGNTMCYIARSMNEENILVLDNMEVLPPYKDEKKYLDMFLLFARRLTKNIGAENMPIYGGARNKFSLKSFEPEFCKVLKILGSSGNDKLVIDSLTYTPNSYSYLVSPEYKFTVNKLYRIEGGQECV